MFYVAAMEQMNELGFYTLPGAPESPRELIDEVREAEELGIHPNTIYARMQKIDRITDRNPLQYHALTELLLVADCAALKQASGSPE